MTPWTVARQVPRSMGFSRHESETASLFSSPGDLRDSGTELESAGSQAGFLPTEPPGKHLIIYNQNHANTATISDHTVSGVVWCGLHK